MKVGSFVSSTMDVRTKLKNWSFGHIQTLKDTDADNQVMTLADTILNESYLEYLSGRCLDFHIIWDRIIPHVEREFLGDSEWEKHNFTESEKQQGFTVNQGKRFYELE